MVGINSKLYVRVVDKVLFKSDRHCGSVDGVYCVEIFDVADYRWSPSGNSITVEQPHSCGFDVLCGALFMLTAVPCVFLLFCVLRLLDGLLLLASECCLSLFLSTVVVEGHCPASGYYSWKLQARAVIKLRMRKLKVTLCFSSCLHVSQTCSDLCFKLSFLGLRMDIDLCPPKARICDMTMGLP